MLKTMTVRTTIAAMLAALSMSAHAIADTQRIDIPAGSLLTALETLAKQANVDLVYQDAQVQGLRTGGVAGDLSPHDAVVQLLQGTPLKVRRDEASGAILIMMPAASAPATSSRPEETRPSFWSRLRLAQSSPSEGENRGEDSRSEVSKSEVTTDTERRAQSPKATELEEIVVTGTQIRGVINNTAPVTVLDKKYVESTGISTLPALIESLPQNFALASQSGVLIPNTSAGQSQGAAINLRGIGEGTTLTLINGRRTALGFGAGTSVDISGLPLTAIERVEILTDGASAMYGSDAIGGVVNFVLRKDFDGAETSVRAGRADGVSEYRVAQTFGTSWSSGNALISAEYLDRGLLHASDRDFVPSTSVIGSLFPEDKNYSVFFSGRQQIAPSVTVFADALYSMRDTYNQGGRVTLNEANWAENYQTGVTAGLTWGIAGDWQIEATGTYSKSYEDRISRSDVFGSFGDNVFTSPFRIKMGQVKADGTLWSLPGGPVRAALGADWRSEEIEYTSAYTTGLIGLQDADDQIVRSVFAEVYVPLVGPANSMRGARSIELSLAGRYDSYSNFGSSTNPKIGLSWEPIEGFRLRGSWGTSYRAPKLSDYSTSVNAAVAHYTEDPGTGGISHVLYVQGTATEDLTAEESTNYTFGLEFSPTFVPQLKLGLNYFHIDYDDRITYPPQDPVVLLGDPAAYSSLFVRSPSPEMIEQAIARGLLGQGFFAYDPNFQPDPNFDPSTIEVLIDGRRRNLSESSVRGMDISVLYNFSLAGGSAHLSIDATHLFEMPNQVTADSATFDVLNTLYNPVDWRIRTGAGWERRGWSANAFINHVASYFDNRFAPAAPIGSYTTVDLRVACDLGQRFGSGWLSGTRVALSAQNVLDEDPPAVAAISTPRDMGFDPTNSNPMGRMVAVELVKTW